MYTFLYNMLDDGNCPINPYPYDVEAYDMAHALQKIAACLDDYTMQVEVWIGDTPGRKAQYKRQQRMSIRQRRKS